jgi:hypothetical protein
MHKTEERSNDKKHSFFDELERVLDRFPKYYMKNLLLDFNAKVETEYIFKSTISNETLHEINNDNRVRLIKFAISKNLIFKSTMFPHCNIKKIHLDFF